MCARRSARNHRVVLGLGKLFCQNQCAKFVGFQCNFLCQHDIASDEISVGYKAPTDARPASVINLMDIHRSAVVNPVSVASVAAGNIEITFCVILRELLWG